MLRETVTILTPAGNFKGHLRVGADGLPELSVVYDHASQMGMATWSGPLRYRPATLPAAWIVTSPTCGTLYSAWDLIWNLIEEIAQAQREAEECGDAKDGERNRATENAIAWELDERRADETA